MKTKTRKVKRRWWWEAAAPTSLTARATAHAAARTHSSSAQIPRSVWDVPRLILSIVSFKKIITF